MSILIYRRVLFYTWETIKKCILRFRMKALIFIVFSFAVCVSYAKGSSLISLSLEAVDSVEIGDAIPIDVYAHRKNNTYNNELEWRLVAGKFSPVRFEVINPEGIVLRKLSDGGIRLLIDNGWRSICDVTARIGHGDLQEEYDEPYVSPVPHGFTMPGRYQVRCSMNMSVRERDSEKILWNGIVRSNWFFIDVKPVCIESLCKSWDAIRDKNCMGEKKWTQSLMKIQFATDAIDQDGLDALLALYKNSSSNGVRTRILRLIGFKGPDGGSQMIAKILSAEKDPFLRSEAIASLIVYPNRLSRKLLLSEIEERRERSFRAALVVLGSVGDETCISVLRDVVAKEKVDWVRERAKESLVKIQKRMTKDEDAH